MKSVVISIMIASCASFTPVKENQTERQIINRYDSQGKAKEQVIPRNSYIPINDKDWKTKGYGKVKR
ncbi:MAG: hypothetical protein HRU72_00275 [Planctomycetia bacterium]|nr:hypothetical protein [Candidatus Brocadia sp.]QOJ05102.1 MAG: hypothetical protein HRU72_00275 [Planctomycetia bacterium]TVL98013.1 MAG: hypothetical protein CV082_02055 [Candidatus Brocadia sp. BL1]HQU30027.1 hypothetical protein [Candidatus Brocadia sapporoensis]